MVELVDAQEISRKIGAVVKLVYTLRSGRSGGNPVKVRVLSAPPLLNRGG